MIVQINTDKTIEGHKNKQEYFTAQILKDLKNYDSLVTRVEVYLKDVNGKKDGLNDILCTLEARIEGRKPTAVTNQANTVEAAISGATNKIKATLKTIVGKLQNH